MVAHLDATVSDQGGACTNRSAGGRPTHPAITACEALVEALALIDCSYERREQTARALARIAQAEHAEAERLRLQSRPEIHAGYLAAESLAADRRRA